MGQGMLLTISTIFGSGDMRRRTFTSPYEGSCDHNEMFITVRDYVPFNDVLVSMLVCSSRALLA